MHKEEKFQPEGAFYNNTTLAPTAYVKDQASQGPDNTASLIHLSRLGNTFE